MQALVKKDLQRIGGLQDLRKLGRSDLVEAATDSTAPEVTLAAWELLGDPAITPPWPSKSGDLETERDLRAKLATMLKGINAGAAQTAAMNELASQGPARWRRFVESASSEAMLQSAVELQNAMGVDAAAVAKLPAAQRFNLSLYQARLDLTHPDPHAAGDAGVRQVITNIVKAANDLPNTEPVTALLQKMASIDAKEPFAARNPGDHFVLAVAARSRPWNLCGWSRRARGRFISLRQNYLSASLPA